MKNNLVKLILLFLAFILTVFLSVFLLFLKIDLIWKIISVILGISLTIIEFITIQKINKDNPIKEVKQNVELTEIEKETVTYSTKHILCPKCYKPFDGKNCFYCGFERK